MQKFLVKFPLGLMLLIIAMILAPLLLLSCYEVHTEVIGAGEGIRIPDLPDGTYIDEEKDLLKIKWDAAAKGYSLEMITKEDRSLSQVRVIKLKDPYLLAQVYNSGEKDPYTLLFVTVEKKEIVIHQSKDSKLEAGLAVKTGAATKEAEFWKEVKTAPAKNLRAFLTDLAASGTLKPTARYVYQEALK